MEASPYFILPPRPTPPDAGTEEHERWCRDSSIVYENGSLTSAYGNWVQLWAAGELPAATIGKDVDTRLLHSQTNQQDWRHGKVRHCSCWLLSRSTPNRIPHRLPLVRFSRL